MTALIVILASLWLLLSTAGLCIYVHVLYKAFIYHNPAVLVDGHVEYNYSIIYSTTLTILEIRGAVFLAIAILFMFWQYRAYKNLEALNTEGKYSGWRAIVSYIIPVFNFVGPVLIMRKVWRGSDPRYIDKLSWKSAPVSIVVILWWLFFWVDILFMREGRGYFTPFENDNLVLYYTIASAVTFLLGIASGVMLIIIVSRITRMQKEKFIRLSWNGTGSYTPKKKRLSMHRFNAGWALVLVYAVSVVLFMKYNMGSQVAGNITNENFYYDPPLRVKVYQNDKLVTYSDTYCEQNAITGTFNIEGLAPGRYHFYFLSYPKRGTINYADTVLYVGNRIHYFDVTLNKCETTDSSTPSLYFQYDREVAEYDIAAGDVKLLECNLSPYAWEYDGNDCVEKFDSVGAKYGVCTRYIEWDGVDSYAERMMDEYNAVVDEYLTRRNGEGWREKYNAEFAGVLNRIIHGSATNVDEFEEYIKGKYKVNTGKAEVVFGVNDDGTVKDWQIYSSIIDGLDDILKNDASRLKFPACYCRCNGVRWEAVDFNLDE